MFCWKSIGNDFKVEVKEIGFRVIYGGRNVLEG
jgi:hypothetical protein